MNKAEKIIPIITAIIMIALVVFYLNKSEFTSKVKEVKNNFFNNTEKNVN